MVLSRRSVINNIISCKFRFSVFTQYFVHILSLLAVNINSRRKRLTLENIYDKTPVCCLIILELITIGSAIGLATGCATGPGKV